MSSEGTSPGVLVEALGVAIRIPATGSAADRLRRQWSRALSDRDATTAVDLDPIDAPDDVTHDYVVTTRVTLAALDATAGLRLNLHAGAVADAEGRAMALIGASGSGKTTAVELLSHRLGYLSDETTSVDESLAVHPHPKPLSKITDRAATPPVKHSLSPDDLHLLRPPESSHLHRIVLLHRGEQEVGLVPLGQARAIAELVPQTSSLARLDQPILRLADMVDACGGAWRLHYRELEHWLDALVDLFDADGRPPPSRRHHPGPMTDPERVPGAWTRTPWRDAVEYDDELVLMVGDDRVHVLAGLGVVTWLALETPRTTEELVAEAEELCGPHPDAPALVADALERLRSEGVVLPPVPAPV